MSSTIANYHLQNHRTKAESLLRTSKSIGSAGDSIESRDSIDVNSHDDDESSEKISTITRSKSPFTIQLVQECSAIRKGLLWERQQNRFFFNRWKARFFVLTTDYLTCFKRGGKKVGMSEMGSFVYKINLGDIKALSWADKKKNGAIGIHLTNTVLFLWVDSESELDQWMISLQEATDRTKIRRETLRKSSTLLPNMMMLTASPSSRLTPLQRTDVNLLNPAHHSPLHHFRSGTPEMNSNGALPPPPPPRRYLRCLSTDLDGSSSSDGNNHHLLSDANKTSSAATSRTALRTMLRDRSASPGLATLQKQFELDRKSSISSAASSLRMKPPTSSITMSPLIMSCNSPSFLAQSQQRRSTSKRLSTIGSSGQQNQQSRPTSQFQVNTSNQAAKEANYEFSFIPIRPPSSTLTHNGTDLTRSFDLESSRAPRVPSHRSDSRSEFRPEMLSTTRNRSNSSAITQRHSHLTTSASLMLPSRRAGLPQVPPHRSNLGPDFFDRPLPLPPVEQNSNDSRQLIRSGTLQYSVSTANDSNNHRTDSFIQHQFPPVPPHQSNLHNFLYQT